ncbi:MAG: DsbA family protein [Hyphomicrobiaceae bacterium]
MAHPTEPNSLVHYLTKPKGALLVAPVIVGAALFFSVLGGGEVSIARDGEQATKKALSATTTGATQDQATGSKPANGVASVVNDKNESRNTPIKLAAADKPTDGRTFSPAQRDEIGRIVREYLLKNPEVLVEVSAELDKRRKAEEADKQSRVLISEKKSIFRSPYDFVLGNPEGDITVVEYFDYNCGWCKRALDEVNKLTGADKNVRVVMKEFPIFGEHSTFAAKAALASIKQNKYWEFHTALMKAKQVTTTSTLTIAKSVGIDVDALKKEMADPQYDKTIQENSRIAQALGMQGTPGFIVDTRVNFGYVPADGLKNMIADIRKEGCKVC